jgi:hypothetical protein
MIKPAIVIVDALPQVLHKLKHDLEPKYSDRYRLIEANSGQQALNQLKQMSLRNEPVALLLASSQPPLPTVRVIDHRWSPRRHEIGDFLARNQVPSTWLDVEKSKEATHLLEQLGLDMSHPQFF